MSALYLPLMLYLVIVFGDKLDDYVGLWAWPLLLAALAATGFVRKRVFAFGDGPALAKNLADAAPPVDIPALGHRVAAARSSTAKWRSPNAFRRRCFISRSRSPGCCRGCAIAA